MIYYCSKGYLMQRLLHRKYYFFYIGILGSRYRAYHLFSCQLVLARRAHIPFDEGKALEQPGV